MEKQIVYGIYDTKDKCWMGQGPEGPNTYTDQDVARAAATVCGQMFKFPLGRIRALPFTDNGVELKDIVQAEMTCDEAVKSLVGKEK